MDWLEWYVANRWVITAFKISRKPDAEYDRWAKAVRMTFRTKAPFYPYREPADLRTASGPPPRTLRVYYLGEARVAGTLGQEGVWPGKTVWANRCPDYTLNNVVNGLGLPPDEVKTLQAKPWHLTEFEDQSSPRPGTHEVFFDRAADQSAVERPPVYFDRYEYVYEDELPGGAERAPAEEVERSRLWLIAVVLGGAALVIAVLLVLALRQASRRG
jgi:hypothetical protein